MFGHTFYHQTLRKYVIIFGTLFNDIQFYRTDGDGNRVQKIKVPLAYGPMEKTLARLENNANLDDSRPAITLPRMSFEMTGLNYASERKLSTTKKFARKDPGDPQKLNTMYQPVPYDISFELNIMVNMVEDGTKILEQIMPFFTPEFTVTANILPEMTYHLDIPVVLEGLTMQDTYENDFETRRALIYTMTFLVKGQLFGPITKSGIITRANTMFYVDTSTPGVFNVGKLSPHHRTTITPGLTNEGLPTTNSELTVDRSQIEPTDNYDYIVNFEEFFSGTANT